MDRKVKVLHILWSGRTGGAERFVYDITKYSKRNKFEHIVVFLAGEGIMAEQIKHSGIQVFSLGMHSGFSVMRGLRLVLLLKKIQPDIINNHVRNYFANYCIFLCSKAKKIYFEHGGGLISDSSEREIGFYKRFGKKYDLVLTNSNHLRERIFNLRQIDRAKVRVFYIGINPSEYEKQPDCKRIMKEQLGIPQDNYIVGVVGRLVKAKGIDDFINIAIHVDRMKGDKKFTYLIIGDGILRSHLEALARSSGLDIRFLGERKDIPELLSIFDLFMFTSKWEPFGIVLLEAMASRIPIVGFTVPGAKEIVEGGGALFIDRRDNLELAKSTIDLLNNNAERVRISKEGYKNVTNNYNIIDNIKNLDVIYSSIDVN